MTEAPDATETSLAAAQSGDHDAFAELYRELQPKLLRYAVGLAGQDAEDITAEAWLQIARDLATFSGSADAFRGWAARIVRNRALDHARYRARRPVEPADLAFLLERPADSDTALLAAENQSTRSALALIVSLPHDQAEAVLLRTVVGLDAATAGDVLGKRAGAVRVAAHRGLRTLAERLHPDSSPQVAAGTDPGIRDRDRRAGTSDTSPPHGNE
ncbi:RNA polymerase sigma factor [Jatrophihabitans telluris]|uniref:RNA polymerase sigma factor n=1 Tax=Jatrophihabitans telluris TaxID=2038343 RepID=A0ABY4R1N0_9ACTN|nr:RNA polymerase sigma factor [Jatrophihabitans telluris]UQX89041.1 RNA polymerase sigma factor [Jatrophihabitans telluris]